jgi:intracellular septation protein
MRDFLNAVKLLAVDLASTLFFLALLLLTHNTVLAVSLGMALGIAQIGTQFLRRKPIGAVGWLSLVLLIASGPATLFTNDPRFMLFKPNVFYAIAGVVMLKPSWMQRYMPAIARTVVADVAIVYGFVWAGLMFVSAAVNAFVALTCSIATWALTMPIFGIVSKVAVFPGGYAAMHIISVRRVRAMPAFEREALLASTGRRPAERRATQVSTSSAAFH